MLALHGVLLGNIYLVFLGCNKIRHMRLMVDNARQRIWGSSAICKNYMSSTSEGDGTKWKCIFKVPLLLEMK